ncbi:MAG: single-stranded DNA-binding protein [Prevotella sp.]|nr:single-stranded DNA-binding protein [Prevotella sp.]
MNKVMLIGNVGKEPEIRYYEADQAIASFPLATTERAYTLQNGTQVPEHTDWHNIVLWRGLAKIAERYVHKGDKLYIEGRIRYRSYDDQKGQRRYVTEILGENMELLSPKPANPNDGFASEPTTQQGNSNDSAPF